MLKEKDILKRYEILRLIGEGGFSKVWLAMDINMNKQWAVKEIDKSSVEYRATVNERQTMKEIEIMAELDHPSLPRIVDIIDEEDALYVVMDYIEGESLKKVLSDYGKQDQEMVAAWTIEICDVLDYLHHLDPPIIYKDMKPSNIMLKPDGTIKVIDFGIARRYEEGKDDTVCFGSNGYASPEHFKGRTDVRSDIYTVGATMYHLLTGEHPAEREESFEQKPIRELDPSLSSGLEQIIIKATKYAPSERFQSAEEMMQAVIHYKKLELPYIEELDRKVKTFRKLVVSALVTFILAAGLFLTGEVKETSTYEALLENENPDSSIRIAELNEAVKLKPEKTDAYIALIKEYSEDGFTEDEASEFLITYNGNKEALNRSSYDYTQLNFDIGKAFLLYYTGSSDDSTRHKLMSAETFFRECTHEDFEEKELAEGYCELADFYENYLTSSSELVSPEATKEEHEAILKRMEQLISMQPDSEEGQRMKLVAATVIMMLLDEERSMLAQNDVEKEKVISLIGKIEEEIVSIDSTKHTISDKADKLYEQAELLKEKIDLTYLNEERSGSR